MTGFTADSMSAQINYFRLMKVEPTPHGIMRWIDREIKIDGEYDRKYGRRLIEALIRVCGGNPDQAYKVAGDHDWEGDEE